MQLYSWKDIERYCNMNRELWTMDLDFIEVYPSEIVVSKNARSMESIEQVFQKLFPFNFEQQSRWIKLDIGNITIPIVEGEYRDILEKQMTPLFRKILYHDTSYPKGNLPVLHCPLIAFHSYKGGVGRTLSLLAFVKAWSTAFSEVANKKLLIIDSDIEAPGLTWIQEDSFVDTFSYLDLLSLIQDNVDIDRIVDLACSKIGSATITIDTPIRSVEHFFIPTYRYKEQLLDLYASPETIVNGKDKGYVLAEVISEICNRIGAAAAMVDLRAGISEFSATLLLDPRVKKYLVTSTSTQSIKGTQIVLEYLMKGMEIQEETILPEILLSMVPDTLSAEEKNDIVSELLQCYEQSTQDNEANNFIDNVVTDLPFASELIHLTSLNQILHNLQGRDMFIKIQKLVDQTYGENISSQKQKIEDNSRKLLLEKIHDLANMQLTAEGNSNFNLLMTAPLKFLEKKYTNTVPTTVIMGAKGSGKTFLYRKLVEMKDWFNFCNSLQFQPIIEGDGFFIPVVSTRNANEMIAKMQDCINNLNSSIPYAHADCNIYLDNWKKLEHQKTIETDWFLFWEELLSSSFDPALKRMEEVNNVLTISKKKIVFLIDGLEEIFRQVSESEQECQAVQVLCQDTISQLSARYPNIGIIVFLRRDMAHDAITVNFEQFAQMYQRTELKWSSNEALRLAVWLVSQADKTFYNESISIDVASQDIIEQYLIKLWGSKLGKPSSNEAYSSRWILAALSDFNGQLQARDIIRFLKYATTPVGKKPPYNDRYLMPAEIKDSVSKCSTEKIEEVKMEYAALRPIFEKLDQLPSEQKVLPLNQSFAMLTSAEEKSMIQEGYLKRDRDKYYLPEIIRHALSFRYDKGARPKVLSLLLKR